MPRLSDSMEEGTILKWLKQVGDQVSEGEELVEIETDKANMTYEADASGVLVEIVAAEGQTLPIGELIARIGAPGEVAGDGAGDGAPKKRADPVEETEVVSEPPPPTVEERAEDGRIKASPLARRIARESGLDLAAIAGTGPGGRIVKADVEAAASGAARRPEAAVAERPAAAVAAPVAAPAPAIAAVRERPETAKGETAVEELTKIQQTVARRMAESKATAPHFYLTVEIDMSQAVALRGKLKELARGEETIPSFNDMVVKASGRALREHPRANGAYRDGRIELYSRVNVGIAVAAQDALIVPTVFDADQHSLGDIARLARALIERVRAGKITPPELSGGTFTVSNLGMYGIDDFAAVINPPQAALLAVGAVRKKPVVDAGGEIVARDTMSATLACDHRILYGSDGAELLGRIRELLEEPFSLAL